MTLPAQLRAIADRLEANDQERLSLLYEAEQLVRVPGNESSVQVADERVPSEGQPSPSAPSGSAPIEQAVPSPVTAGARQRSPQPASDTVSCPDCGLPFSARGLGVHRRHVHGHKAVVHAPATCPDCGKTLSQGHNLARHRQMVHAGKKVTNGAPVLRKGSETFLCSRCPMRFDSRDGLERHLVLDHPDNEPRRLPVGQAPPRDEHEAAGRILRGGASQSE